MSMSKIKRFLGCIFLTESTKAIERKMLSLSEKVNKIELHLMEQSNAITMLTELIYAIQTDGYIEQVYDQSPITNSGQDKKIYLLNYLPGSDDDDIMN